jgi:ribosomal protein S16
MMSIRNRHHKAIVAKLSRIGSAVEVRMVATGLSEEDSFKLENERIVFWREAGADLTNMTDGGEGVSGLKMSDEAKAKMRLAKLGKKQTPEQIERRVAPLRGRKQPPGAIEKSAAKRRGKKLSAEHKANISASHKGKVISEEARKNLSLANKGKPWSEARRAFQDNLLLKKKGLV